MPELWRNSPYGETACIIAVVFVSLHVLRTLRMSRKDLIQKHSSLFWYTPEGKKDSISDALLVETLLNYGSLDDFKELISTLGLKHVAEVFRSLKGRQKGNYDPATYHFFSQVFDRYAAS